MKKPPLFGTLLGLSLAAVLLGPGVAASYANAAPWEIHASYGHRLSAGGRGVALWWASSGWKISRGRDVPADRDEAIAISAARNEAEAAQLVVRPKHPLKGFTVKSGKLHGPEGGEISADRVDVLRVGYVRVTKPTDKSSQPGLYPDPLPPLKDPIDLKADQNQPLWVRIHVPRDIPAGTYKGVVHLRAKGWKARVPLRVRVYGFTLPDEMTCQTSFGLSLDTIWKYQNLKDPAQRRKVLQKYLQDFGDHHLSPYHPAPLTPYKVTWKNLDKKKTFGQGEQKDKEAQDHEKNDEKGGDENDRKEAANSRKKADSSSPAMPEPTFDFTDWDQAMSEAMSKWHFNSFVVRLPHLGGGKFHETSLFGYGPKTPQFKVGVGRFLKKLQAHLREKGWLDESVIFWFDEPNKKDYPQVRREFELFKKYAPDIPRRVTEQVEPGLIGGPDIWCPMLQRYQPKKAARRRRAGDTFWWYICTAPKAPYPGEFIDHPAGTELRVWLWQTWKYHVKGVLIWRTNYWTSRGGYPDADQPQNPYEDTMSWVSAHRTGVDSHRPWGNGDGRMLYPPEAAADAHPHHPVLDGPVDSLRWEMLRDGVEDYEYLAMLKRLLKAHGSQLDPPQREKYEVLLKVPSAVAKSRTSFTSDPRVIEKRREQVAHAVVRLTQRFANQDAS